MMKARAYLIAAILLLIAAAMLTFMPLARWGYHTDARSCSENTTHQSFYTATGYFISTHPFDKNSVSIGTCPYQNFNARTYALELWILGIALGYLGYRKLKHSEPASKSNLN